MGWGPFKDQDARVFMGDISDWTSCMVEMAIDELSGALHSSSVTCTAFKILPKSIPAVQLV